MNPKTTMWKRLAHYVRRFGPGRWDEVLSELRGLRNEIDTIRNQTQEIKSLALADLKAGDPLDWFVVSNYHFMYQGHFHTHYDEWRMRRIRKVLELYGGDFSGKRILEIGGGIGDIGAFFARLGATVCSLEGRVVNRQLAAIKFRAIPGFQSVACDVEEDFSHLGRFDLIINFGLIEVVKDIDNVMECCCRMSDHVFLETMVCDSTDPDKIVYVDMDPDGVDHPMYGKSARPSPFYIERFFEKKGFAIQRAFHADLNTHYHAYDWEHRNSAEINNRNRRFWYFTKGGSRSP